MKTICKSFQDRGVATMTFGYIRKNSNTGKKEPINLPKGHENITLANCNNYWNSKSLAILCGERSNLLVLDCDIPKEGEKNLFNAITFYKSLLQKLDTPIACTPSGGYHVFFKWTPNIKTTQKALLTGIRSTLDVRSDKSFVFASPTTFDKKSYTWINSFDDYEPIELSESISKMISSPKKVEYMGEVENEESLDRLVELMQKHDDGLGEIKSITESGVFLYRDNPSECECCGNGEIHHNDNNRFGFYKDGLAFIGCSHSGGVFLPLEKNRLCRRIEEVDEEKDDAMCRVLSAEPIASNEMDAGRIYFKLFNKSRFVMSNNILYIKRSNVWENTTKEKEQLKAIISTRVVKIKVFTAKGEVLFDVTTSNKNLNGVVGCLYAHLLEHQVENFEELCDQSCRGKICYTNGVYDMPSRTFKLWAQCPDVYTMCIVNREFDATPVDTNKAYKLFYDILNCNKQVDELLFSFSRALAGNTEDKRWYQFFGSRDSGKGVITTLLENTFGSYIDNINGSNFVTKTTSGDSAKEMSWVVAVRRKRIVFGHELPSNKTMNGEMIKKISSGGDSITARQNYMNELSFKPNFTFYLCSNDICPCDPEDATENRFLINMPWQFKTKAFIEAEPSTERQKYYKQAVTDIKQTLCRDIEILRGFEQLLYDVYPIETPLLKTLAKNSVSAMDRSASPLKEFVLKFVFTFDKKNKISNAELKGIFKDYRAYSNTSDSDQKLQMELIKNGANKFKIKSVRGLKGLIYMEEN